ncbi:MAG: hypothetical protein LBM38_01175 [Clostridiales bacterium]|nr:hypothetical protein [Clostridiales bacterium]
MSKSKTPITNLLKKTYPMTEAQAKVLEVYEESVNKTNEEIDAKISNSYNAYPKLTKAERNFFKVAKPAEAASFASDIVKRTIEGSHPKLEYKKFLKSNKSVSTLFEKVLAEQQRKLAASKMHIDSNTVREILNLGGADKCTAPASAPDKQLTPKGPAL